MPKETGWIFLVLFIMGGLFLNACQPSPPTVPRPGEEQLTVKKQEVQEVQLVKVTKYSDTCYFFPYVDEEFGRNYVWFMQQHPELEALTMAPEAYNGNHYQRGYFVTFKKVEVPKKEVTNEPAR